MENKKIFKAPALIPDHGLKTTADKGIRVIVETQEIPPQQKLALFELAGKFGWFVFAETEPDRIEIPDEKPEFKGQKSQAQRLRACLYKLWEKKGKLMDFELFYRTKMDGIIEQIKNRLL